MQYYTIYLKCIFTCVFIDFFLKNHESKLDKTLYLPIKTVSLKLDKQ